VEQFLPGGVVGKHGIDRSFSFKPLTGEIELNLAESIDQKNLPDAVTYGLCAALEQVGGIPVQTELIGRLSVGDRQFLMRKLNLCFGHDANWYSASCCHCHVDFDFYVELSSLPVKEAGEGYPFAEVETSLGRCYFRIPNGEDQRVLSHLDGQEDACAALIRRCLISIDNVSDIQEIEFSDSDKQQIEARLEVVAPEVGCEVQVACMECGFENTVALNSYTFINHSAKQVLADIHKIAAYYHWSEKDILTIPIERRNQYLGMINQARSMNTDTNMREE